MTLERIPYFGGPHDGGHVVSAPLPQGYMIAVRAPEMPVQVMETPEALSIGLVILGSYVCERVGGRRGFAFLRWVKA